MTNPPTESGSRVIHVAHARAGQPPFAVTAHVDEWLVEADLTAIHVGDVYRALATILSRDGERLSGVVVCMDALGVAELEFFSLVARHRRELPVYVYSNSGVDLKPAFGRGAAGPALRETIAALAGPSRSASSRDQKGSSLPPSAATGPHVDARADEELVDRNFLAESSEASPARVPWLRYADRPTRTAPERAASVPGAPSAAPARSEDAYEPLLTQAELEALMSDDVSTIAPHEPPGWAADGPPRGIS